MDQPVKSVASPVNQSVEPAKPLPGMKFIGDVLKKDKGNLSSFDDFTSRRKQVFDYAHDALKQRFPISNDRYTLELADTGYADVNPITLKEQKNAVLNNLSLSKKLQGRWVLRDNKTGSVVDKTSKRTIMNVPYLTDRGTFIRNGTEYSLINQFRLIPGVFSKWTEDGRIEAHVNVRQGTGNTFKIYMEPKSAEFYIKAKNRKMKLYPVLNALGVKDSQLEEVWGKDILERNKRNAGIRHVHSAIQTLTPSYRKLNKTAKEETYDLNPQEMEEFKGSLAKSELDPDATQTTLGARHNNVSPALFMDVTKKLIKMSRNEVVGDDRDSLEFQRLYGAPQFIAERILKDPGNIIKNTMWKATGLGNLSKVQSGTMNKYLDALYNTSGLGQAVEEINPFDMLDQSYRVTRMGEGGISDTHQIPDEARAVQPTYRAFVDPIRSPECYDDKTEVMTSKGWKFFKDITKETSLACLIEDTLEFHVPDRILEYDYEGILYGAKTDTMDYLVTPEHRMWTRPIEGSGYRWELAKDITRKNRMFNSGKFNPLIQADEIYNFDLPRVKASGREKQIIGNPPIGANLKLLKEPIDIYDWCEFLGWYLSEGSFSIDSKKGRYIVRISQSLFANPDNCLQIEALLNRLPFAWCRDGQTGYFITGKQLTSYCATFGDCAGKYIPEEIFKAPLAAKRLFIEAALKGDGRKDSSGRISSLCTTSKRFAEDFHFLLFLMGHSSSISYEPDEREERYLGCYVVRVHSRSERAVYYKNNKHPEGQYYTSEYRGKVYCATVPGGALYIRRNGNQGFWCGNSEKVGVDLKLTHNVKIGEDGVLYREMFNPRTGKREMVSSVNMARKIVGFPESFKVKGNFAPAMVRGEGMKYVPKKDIDYVIEHGSDLFSLGSNLVPLHSGVKGMRLLMGSKMISQALPLVNREAPLVRPTDRDGNTFNSKIEKYMGTRRADQDGVVKKVSRDGVTVQYKDGTTAQIDLYDNFPFARKSGIKNNAIVKEGQKVRKGEVLATSNYTDNTGHPALGTNLRVAFVPYKGYSFEDGIVLSESAAKKLTSEHTYATKVRDEEGLDVSRNTYIQMYPGRFTEAQYKTITPEGVVKPGTVVHPGDPLVLAVKAMPPSIRTLGRRTNRDHAETWDYPESGVVTDVVKNRDGWHVYVRANSPAKPADKLAGMYGNKGVVSNILPDSEMPHDKDGKPYDILLNPLGVISRTNSAQLVEAALGKIAAKTGKPYNIAGFTDDPEHSMVDFALNELKKNNVSDTEDIWDPTTGKKIPQIFTGVSHFYKLQHTAEAKSGGRSFGGYTLENQPSSGGKEGGKRIGSMEVAALVSHGAQHILQDMKMIKSQRNDDYWRDLKMGKNPPMPRDNFMFNKFLSSLKASGINVDQDKDRYNIFAMTNNQLKSLVGSREIQSSDTFDPKHFKAIPGGLFDEKLTGGAEGDKFAYIKLDEPMLNPVMEIMAKKVLGLTERQFEDLVSGVTEYKGKRGGEALKQKLADVDIKPEIIKTVHDIKASNGTKRDTLVKKLRALKSLEEHDTRPEDFMFDRIPVIPPRYRPISASEDMTLASDFNYLYRELMFNRDDLREAKEKLPDDMLSDIRKSMYNNFKALTGLGDSENVELREKGVKGILKHIFGNSGKFGMFQRKMIGGPLDLSARTAITPNPNMKLNQVGLPESVAWELYEPFVIRDMVRHGTPMVEAAKAVADKNDKALRSLKDVMKERPVLFNRAPTMHKWGFMAAWPMLIKGHTFQVAPPICGPFNADFDGDTMAIHVPVSEDAVREAKDKMLPEKNLIGARDYSLIYAPSNEYVQGAYLSTKNPAKGLPVTFDTEEQAVQAYRTGKIDVDTPVKIRKRKIQ